MSYWVFPPVFIKVKIKTTSANKSYWSLNFVLYLKSLFLLDYTHYLGEPWGIQLQYIERRLNNSKEFPLPLTSISISKWLDTFLCQATLMSQQTAKNSETVMAQERSPCPSLSNFVGCELVIISMHTRYKLIIIILLIT